MYMGRVGSVWILLSIFKAVWGWQEEHGGTYNYVGMFGNCCVVGSEGLLGWYARHK